MRRQRQISLRGWGKETRCWLYGLAWALCLVGLAVAAGQAQAAASYRLQAVLTGENLGRFQQPQGVFYNAHSNRLLIADTSNNRLVIYRETEGGLTVYREIEMQGGVRSPVHFVVTSEGRIILSDPHERQVLILYSSGKLVGPLDLSRVPDGDSILPGAIALDPKDQLYLVDETNHRILIFDAKGRYQRAIKPDDPTLRGLNAVAVDASSNIYALDTLGGRVYQFSPNGEQQKTFGRRGPEVDQFDFPVALAVDRRGFIYVLDRHRSAVLVFNRSGRYQARIASRGRDKGKLLYPADITVDETGRIYIADHGNHRVQVFVRIKE